MNESFFITNVKQLYLRNGYLDNKNRLNTELAQKDESLIASMFDRIAPKYDFLNQLLSFKQDLKWRQALFDRVQLPKNYRLLDVATGTGDVAIGIASRHKEFEQIIGVDISQQMLDLAKVKKLKRTPSPKMLFQNMSAMDLKLTGQSFDAVTISFGLRNTIDKVKSISEMSRVLKPGGRLYVLEFYQPTFWLFNFFYSFYFHYILPLAGSILGDRTAYKYLPKSVANFCSAEELDQICADQGLKLQHRKDFMFGSTILMEWQK